MTQPVLHLAPEPGYRIHHCPATLIDTRVSSDTGRLTLHRCCRRTTCCWQASWLGCRRARGATVATAR